MPKKVQTFGIALALSGLLLVAGVLVVGAQSGGPGNNTVYIPIVNRGGAATPAPTPGPVPVAAHAVITAYDGPQTCLACHAKEGQDAAHSEHVQWTGKWKEVNTYCTAPEPADYACLSCHATTGKVLNPTANDVDCLICHQDAYQRSLQPLSINLTVVDWQGNTKVYHVPQKNAQGNYTFQPRFDLMSPGTTMVQLARTVHLPTRGTCLRCHAKAGGGDGVKRGDLSTASINPAYNSDVHLSPQGGNLLCQDCHVPTNHQIPGKGIDLRISEGGTVKDCKSCHTADVNNHSAKLLQHMDRVSCQTCHIPKFGKDVATEMSRDWRTPHWNPAGCNGQGAWIGEEVKASNVKPEYTFWNGQSSVYSLQNPIQPDPNGQYTLADALGSISDGKIYPIKVHTAWQPRSTATGRMVQYDVLWNFMTGFFEQAAQRGLIFMGLQPTDSNGNPAYQWVNTRAEQLITHGVEPAANALACANCHGGGQMNFQAMGYALKGPQSQVCTQCHGAEKNPGFTAIHSKHVDQKRYDCSKCHNFTRPERGLTK